MKIILFSRQQLAHNPAQIAQLFATLRHFGLEYSLNAEFADIAREVLGEAIPAEKIYTGDIGEQPAESLMVCYGGDGTLLEGVHRLCGAPIPVLGINAGHLGFLTSAAGSNLPELFEQIVAGNFTTEARSMLRVEGDFAEQPHFPLSLNEFAVQRHGAGMIAVETYVDNQMVATYHGDGVIVSTPTGSTAYSLSAGGPVVAPTCSCFIISPLAPHNLTMRPMVIPDTATVTLRVRARRSEVFVTLDDRTHAILPDAEFTIKRAEQKIFLAIPHNISFYDTLRNKMMWGIDIRS